MYLHSRSQLLTIGRGAQRYEATEYSKHEFMLFLSNLLFTGGHDALLIVVEAVLQTLQHRPDVGLERLLTTTHHPVTQLQTHRLHDAPHNLCTLESSAHSIRKFHSSLFVPLPIIHFLCKFYSTIPLTTFWCNLSSIC